PTAQASTSIPDFHTLLTASDRILCLAGAGLSASSGLETFRGDGRLWHNYQVKSIASQEAFECDPGLCWLYYAARRHEALIAKPNKGHHALAELARRIGKERFMCLSQNVDGLSQRAGHPSEQLKPFHGSLFNLKCNSCPYTERDNSLDPINPSLITDPLKVSTILQSTSEPFHNRISFLSPTHTPALPRSSLPHCPACKTDLLRPDVVWFGEGLDKPMLKETDEWMDAEDGKLDIMLVVGTTAVVYPAASYIKEARRRGARVVVVNASEVELGSVGRMERGDFLFLGDAEEILPKLFEPL
ncbi:Sir2 family protein, partial [Tricladium varicosporioides]